MTARRAYSSVVVSRTHVSAGVGLGALAGLAGLVVGPVAGGSAVRRGRP